MPCFPSCHKITSTTGRPTPGIISAFSVTSSRWLAISKPALGLADQQDSVNEHADDNLVDWLDKAL
jgi:hypothetical protein